ncbi:hybrid sensor histidine kinase/response regulator [Roseateles cellulosilyticus]|uniref:histidine kinase n=1 Tax=Pelomonas cellulosilytica TaxID=2906762 RepID=A0ABS8XQU8_9BURK|nr:ATP-binding protein [Pelomonas sp. P8]MCE4555109.1 ATP-binding protein [Pelomonas sp. P8]
MAAGRTLIIVGPVGTRWLFGVIVASALAAWASEEFLNVIDPKDRIAYPLLAIAFTAMAWGVGRFPQRLQAWQRGGVTLLALYFTLGMLAFTGRPDPGPSLYTLASLTPWTLGGCLLLYTTWPARQALAIALGMLALMMAPPTLLRFAGAPPQWLVEAWPLLANLALCQLMFCLALWGLSGQLARLLLLAPAGRGLATADDLLKARMAELEQSREAAEAASRAKSDFLGNIGHEIRTPMNTVLGQTRLLLGGRLTAEQRGQLQEVAHAGETLIQIIDSLLDYADLDAGRLQLASEPVRLEQLLASAIDAVRPAAQAKQLELLCDIAAPELLAEAGARRGDITRLTQLLTELLVNAVKFTPAGHVRLTAALEAGGAWRLSVRDSGVGMSAEQMGRLFSPFAQAEAGAARRFGGTGLGLAICRALAERMGGTLTARSTPGRGSTFDLLLPLPPCPELPPQRRANVHSVLVVQAPHSAGHEALLALVKALAPAAQLEVMTQGSHALGRLARTAHDHPHDLMLVDWVLPDMEGGELLRQLAEVGPPRVRRIALLSAFDTPVLRERALRRGAQAMCAKPLLPHTLRRLLDLERPLAVEVMATPQDTNFSADETVTLMSQLDTLLNEADSHALTLWEQHASAFIDMLPEPQAQALAGAMQRFDFDEALAALRGDNHHRP